MESFLLSRRIWVVVLPIFRLQLNGITSHMHLYRTYMYVYVAIAVAMIIMIIHLPLPV
jgi:hypothetical protein